VQGRPEKKVTLSTAKHDWAVRIEVSDNGPGMTEHTLQELFRPFFTTKGALGTGLGLYMSRKAVNAHGRKLEVKSVPDNGTTVSILIPINKRASARRHMAWVIRSRSEYRAALRELQSLSRRIEQRRQSLTEMGFGAREVETMLKPMMHEFASLNADLKNFSPRPRQRKFKKT